MHQIVVGYPLLGGLTVLPQTF